MNRVVTIPLTVGPGVSKFKYFIQGRTNGPGTASIEHGTNYIRCLVDSPLCKRQNCIYVEFGPGLRESNGPYVNL